MAPHRKNDLVEWLFSLVSPWRYRQVRRSVGGRIPLNPDGRKIVADRKSVDDLLKDALLEHPSLIERVAGIFNRLSGRPENNYPQPELLQKIKRRLLKDFRRAAEPLSFDAKELARKNLHARQRILMTAPDELYAGQEIEDRMTVMKKWLSAHHALLEAGAKIELIPSSENKGGIREVYTRDRFVIIGNVAYLPDPAALKRLVSSGEYSLDDSDVEGYRGEIEQVEGALKERGVETVTVKGAWFEGGNVIRHMRTKTLFMGIDPPWSKMQSARKLIRAVNATQSEKWNILGVPLENAVKMYHLDTGMSEELPQGEIMISPLVTNEKTLKKIEKIVGSENIIELADDEANRMATNFMHAGETLVMTSTLPDLKSKLQTRGYKVVTPEDYGQSTFEFGLGGVHCMTNDLPPPKP